MEREEAVSALREVAVEVLSVDPDTVVEEARFKEDLDADSLDLVELVMGLEERFDISVPEEDLENVGTVGQRRRAPPGIERSPVDSDGGGGPRRGVGPRAGYPGSQRSGA